MIPLVIINEVTKHGFFPPLSSINLIKTTGIGERSVNIELTVFQQLSFDFPSFTKFYIPLN